MIVHSTVIASLIPPAGEIVSVMLPSDMEQRLRELQRLVGGYIETIPLLGDLCMVLNENGKDGLSLGRSLGDQS